MKFIRKHPGGFALGLSFLLGLGFGFALWTYLQSAVLKRFGYDRAPGELPDLLAHPGEAVLYSIDPSSNMGITPKTDLQKLYGYDVLGSTPLTPEQGRDLAQQFQRDLCVYIEEERRGQLTESACFDPRHLLEIQYQGHVYDFLVCFACEEVHVYKDRKLRLAFVIPMASARPFNKILMKAKVPLPTVPKTDSSW